MKKTLIAGLLLASPLAVNADTGPGCGWGAMLFDGQDGLAPNVLAATTNGILGNQTFGMTTGTAGCDPSQPVTMTAVDIFLDANMERVARDMATGHGESLTTLAGLMGIEDSDKGTFFTLAQKNFDKIFSKDSISSSEVLVALKGIMKTDHSLAKYVS
jgi:hypothetical protein